VEILKELKKEEKHVCLSFYIFSLSPVLKVLPFPVEKGQDGILGKFELNLRQRSQRLEKK